MDEKDLEKIVGEDVLNTNKIYIEKFMRIKYPNSGEYINTINCHYCKFNNKNLIKLENYIHCNWEKIFLKMDNNYIENIEEEFLEINNDKDLENVFIEKVLSKYNEKNNKLRWDLVPWNAFEKIVEIITEGAKEENYGVDNWKTQSSKLFDAAMIRHYVAYKKGERYDSRWNLTHLAHLACNALFLLWKELLVINIENKEKGELKSTEALNKEKED